MSRQRAYAGVMLLHALALTPSISGAAEATSIERGLAIVQRNCAQCHAVGPRGESPNTMAPPFRSLQERYDVENLQEALAEGILTGHPAMPEFRFNPREISDIVDYLKSLNLARRVAARSIEAGPKAN
jgi:cytochrome c